MKRTIAFLLFAALLCSPVLAIETLQEDAITIPVPSAVLMEKSTGELIYAKKPHEKLSPASITKIMTLLLVVEEIENGNLSLNDTVTASAYAAGMGGSQIWLEEGEQMSVEDMLKCVAISSANDCSVALAEHICGSEEAFVARMNQRAAELGMKNTHFTNCTGLLDNSSHYTSAYDVALMSRELIRHDIIKKYTTIWMDTVRNGEFGLTNTNRLVRFYEGTTGLKTGFTSKAMHCLAATAERDGVEYIAVVMHGATSTDRFESAKTLLNYAFANYALASLRAPEALPPVYVELGQVNSVQPVYDGKEAALVKKTELSNLEYSMELCESVRAPVTKGQSLGTLTVTMGGKPLAEVPIVAGDDVEKLSRWQIFRGLLDMMSGE
ncbi:MAG TPA: D-alanyl-D-alanine carboxypeptidase [Clostridiales bacterium]|nr:D-alanyl-D-alanine carboxypeptidase [Clostridiales bacterium]